MLTKEFITNKVYAVLSKVSAISDQKQLEGFFTSLFADVIKVNNKFTSPSGRVWENFETFVMFLYCLGKEWVWVKARKEVKNYLVLAASREQPVSATDLQLHLSSYLRSIFIKGKAEDLDFIILMAVESMSKVVWRDIAEAITLTITDIVTPTEQVVMNSFTDTEARDKALAYFFTPEDLAFYKLKLTEAVD